MADDSCPKTPITDPPPPPFRDYDEFQQLFSLSVASNAVGLKRNTERKLQQDMQQALNRSLWSIGSDGDWEVVWGPAVHKQIPSYPLSGPVNAWFVARSSAQNTYVVSIAGTSAVSCKAILEDINIVDVVDFNAWVAGWTATRIPDAKAGPWDHTTDKPFISEGTYFFTKNVVSRASPANAASPGTLLGEFLQQNVADSHLVFTGHSMGAAVAPTVALGYYQAGFLSTAASVRVLPSAGATPGNSAFATAFTTAFPQDGPFNTNWYNPLDIVPQAFNTNASLDRYFSRVPELYKEATGGARKFLNTTYGYVDKRVKKSMPYGLLPGTSFEPRDGIPATHTGDDIKCSAEKQHIEMYIVEAKVEGFWAYFRGDLKSPDANMFDFPEGGGDTLRELGLTDDAEGGMQ